MARSVLDATLLYNVMQGPDSLDPRTRGISPDDPTPAIKRGIRGLRLARMPETERAGVAAEVLAAYDASLDTLARLGAEIVTVELPRRFADFTDLTGRIIGAEGYFLVGHLVDDMTLPIDDAARLQVGDEARHVIVVGHDVPRFARRGSDRRGGYLLGNALPGIAVCRQRWQCCRVGIR